MQITDYGKLGIGTWYLGENTNKRKEEIEAIQFALDNNVSIIDTAEMYGSGLSEKLIGEAIQDFNRKNIFLISKVLPNNANKINMERSLEQTLKNLKTDYLDMYLYHWRGGTPLQETVSELERLKKTGKIKSWGVSNFDLEDMIDLMNTEGGNMCKVNQVLYHLGSRGIEVALKPYQDNLGIMTMAYCPLAQGGKLRKQLITHPNVLKVAKELEINPYQVLLCFTLSHNNMISIPRTSKVNHMKELVECLKIDLDPNQIRLLNSAFPVPENRVPLDIQ